MSYPDSNQPNTKGENAMNNKLFAYGLSHRGCSIGTQPVGFDHFEDTDKATTGFYSVVYYENELSADEISKYELTPITEEIKTEEPEEVKEEKTISSPEDLEALINDEGLELAAMMMLRRQTNSNLIMLAGIDAGIFTAKDFSKYLFMGIMPKYHTFNEWKRNGYIVKKGSKAAFVCKIWDFKTSKKGEYTAEEAAKLNAIIVNADGSQVKEGDPKTHSQYYKFNAYFFGPDQVEKLNYKELDTLPDDCKKEIKDGREIITGNTKEIKEQLKAAGYQWHRKNQYWSRLATA